MGTLSHRLCTPPVNAVSSLPSTRLLYLLLFVQCAISTPSHGSLSANAAVQMTTIAIDATYQPPKLRGTKYDRGTEEQVVG